MFTRNAVCLFLYLHLNKIDAAVPIDIVIEKTNEAKLSQHFPYIIPMIPDKEPLITAARKQGTDEKDPAKDFLNKPLPSPNRNTTKIIPYKITEKETRNSWLQQTASPDKLIEKIPKEISQNTSVPKTLYVNTNHRRRTSIKRTKISLKKPLVPQRKKRSLKEHNDFVDQSFSGEEDMSKEEDLRRRYGNRYRGKWDGKYKVYRYESGYEDYDIPFPYYEPRPAYGPGSPAHGVGLFLPQLSTILKSMLFKTSSFISKRNIYSHRPGSRPLPRIP